MCWICVRTGSTGSNDSIPVICHVVFSGKITISGRWRSLMNCASVLLNNSRATLFKVTLEQYSCDSNSGPNSHRERRISGCRVCNSSVWGSSASCWMVSITLIRLSISSRTRSASLTVHSVSNRSRPSISSDDMEDSFCSNAAPLLVFSRLMTAFTAVARKSGEMVG